MKRKRILLIDDETEFCRLVRIHMELSGKLEVFTATTGKEGLEAARHTMPHLILLDIMMPGGMDGFEVLKKLKQDSRTVGIPVVMLTAAQDDASKIEATQLYDEDYIAKPVKLKELKTRVEKILDRFAG